MSKEIKYNIVNNTTPKDSDIKTPESVILNKKISSSAVMLYMFLQIYKNKNNCSEIDVSNEWLCDKLNCTVRNVQILLKGLVKEKIIKITANKAKRDRIIRLLK